MHTSKYKQKRLRQIISHSLTNPRNFLEGLAADTALMRLGSLWTHAVTVSLWTSLVIFFGVVLLQLAAFTQSFSYTSFVLTVILTAALILSTLIRNKYIIGASTILLVLMGLVVRWKTISFLHLKPISDLLITYNSSKEWVKAPHVALHEFLFPHWGIYGLFLKDWFGLVGASVTNAKILNVLAYLMVMVMLLMYLFVVRGRKSAALATLALAALYPTFAMYVNFLSGEYLFMGLFSISIIFLVLLTKSRTTLTYFVYLLCFVCFFAFASLLKQMMPIVIPVSLFCTSYFLFKKNHPRRILPTIAIVLLLPMIVQGVCYHRLQYYSQGPPNRHLTNLFLASGLSRESNGQLDSRYYDPYVANLSKAYRDNTLSEKVYVAESEKLKKVVYGEVKNYWTLPGLFDQKASYIWSNDNNISLWFYTSTSSNRLYIKPLLDNFSNIFYFVISILFILNIYRTIRQHDDEVVNLYAILFVCAYVVASLFIEGQARYRIILIPALLIGTSGGILYLAPVLRTVSKLYMAPISSGDEV